MASNYKDANANNYIRWKEILGTVTLADLQADCTLTEFDFIDAAAPVLSVSVASASKLDLSWNDITSGAASHYEIYRGTVSGSLTLLTTTTNLTSYTDTGLSTETTYYYQVKPVVDGTGLTISNEANETIPLPLQIALYDRGTSLITYSLAGEVWEQTGNTFTDIGDNISQIASLTNTRIATLSDGGLTTYDWDGTDWSKVGNTNTTPSGGGAICGLSSSRVAIKDINTDELETWDFDGTDWSQVGNSLTITGAGKSNLAGLSSTRVAFIDSTLDALTTYDFDGTDWSKTGNSLTITDSGHTITALTASRIAYIGEADQLRAYDFDGTDWSLTGNQLGVTVVDEPSLGSLSASSVAFVDEGSGTANIRTYDFDGTDWTETNTAFSISGGLLFPAIASLSYRVP